MPLVALLIGTFASAPAAAKQPDAPGKYAVGHTTIQIVLTDSLGETRPIDVELWFPADDKAWDAAPLSTYSSRLKGVALTDSWDALAWEIVSPAAREAAAVAKSNFPFPVLVFSAGNNSAPINTAYTLEHVAGHGYIVAAPWHTGNNIDDVRVDFINQRAGFKVLSCLDGLPAPCVDANAGKTIRDRVRDVKAILDTLPSLFGDTVDMSRVAVAGHSRGTVSSLATVGGSTSLGIAADPRVGAVIGFAIGATALTSTVNLSAITVPTLLVAGDRDRNTPATISEAAIGTISSTDKVFVLLESVQHRAFSATFCDTVQAAGAIAQGNSRAFLDRDTVSRLVIDVVNGTPLDWCSFPTFVDPTDIRPLIFSLSGVNVTEDNVPRDGLDVGDVDRLMRLLTVSFLDSVLDAHGADGIHYTRYLAPKFLLKKESSVGRIELWTGEGEICPPGQCED
jgi:predicted dienelactone hydrolase